MRFKMHCGKSLNLLKMPVPFAYYHVLKVTSRALPPPREAPSLALCPPHTPERLPAAASLLFCCCPFQVLLIVSLALTSYALVELEEDEYVLSTLVFTVICGIMIGLQVGVGRARARACVGVSMHGSQLHTLPTRPQCASTPPSAPITWSHPPTH